MDHQKKRVAVVPFPNSGYRLWYTVVFLTVCSRLCFWWFALPLAELSDVCIRRYNFDGVASCLSRSSIAPEPFVFDGSGRLKYRMIGLGLFDLDSIRLKLSIAQAYRFEEADSTKSPIQSLEVVSVALVKVPVNPVLKVIWFVSGEDLFVGKDGGPQVSGVISEEGRLAVPTVRSSRWGGRGV
ncbi:hypothetical protein Bca101_030705 [Brassica carinata]